MKFDVIIGNPPYSDPNTEKTNFRNTPKGENLAKRFINFALDIAKSHVIMIAPYQHKTYSPGVAETWRKQGLYKITQAKEHFPQVKINPAVFWFKKGSMVKNVEDELKPDLKIPEDNLVTAYDFYAQPGKGMRRNEFEHLLKDSGNYKVIVTTSVVKYTNSKSLVDRLKDISYGNWRVVFNANAAPNSTGRISVAAPDEYLSGSVNCFVTNTKKEAVALQKYLQSEEVQEILNSVRISAGNSKKYFQYVPKRKNVCI